MGEMEIRRLRVEAISGLLKTGRRIQGVETMQFSHLCAVAHCHVEGESVPCEDELFEVVPSAFRMCHNASQDYKLREKAQRLCVPENCDHDFASRRCTLAVLMFKHSSLSTTLLRP